MAMIYNLGLPEKDIERISEYMKEGGETPAFEDKKSADLLEEITGGERHPLWRAVIGRFVKNADGNGDVLMDEVGKSTGMHGSIEEDYEQPEAAYVIGVPL